MPRPMDRRVTAPQRRLLRAHASIGAPPGAPRSARPRRRHSGPLKAVNVDRHISWRMPAAPLHEQSSYLEATLRENEVLQNVLRLARELDLPDWYLGAGGVA